MDKLFSRKIVINELRILLDQYRDTKNPNVKISMDMIFDNLQANLDDLTDDTPFDVTWCGFPLYKDVFGPWCRCQVAWVHESQILGRRNRWRATSPRLYGRRWRQTFLPAKLRLLQRDGTPRRNLQPSCNRDDRAGHRPRIAPNGVNSEGPVTRRVQNMWVWGNCMSKRSTFAFICFCGAVIPAGIGISDLNAQTSPDKAWQTQTTSRLRAIYERGEFRGKRFQSEWLPDSSGYIVREREPETNQPMLVQYDVRTGGARWS